MKKTSRRTFAKAAAVAAAFPFISHAQTPPPGTEKPKPEPPPTEEIKPLAAALTAVVTSQYGSYLSAEDVRKVEKDFSDSLSGLERMRKVQLVNSDEPDFSFSVEVRR